MKNILKASVVCTTLTLSVLAHATDEYADLRQSSANMTQTEAKEVEAGALPLAAAAAPYIPYAVAVTTGAVMKYGARLTTPTPLAPAVKKGYDSLKNRQPIPQQPIPQNYTGAGSTIPSDNIYYPR